jgi:hypothetical protein
MADPIIEILSDISGLPTTELVYPQIIFSLILPGAVNIIALYGLNQKLEIFGRGQVNNVVSLVLGFVLAIFAIRLWFFGYITSCIGIAYLYLKNDVIRLLFILVMIGLYWGLQFIVT